MKDQNVPWLLEAAAGRDGPRSAYFEKLQTRNSFLDELASWRDTGYQRDALAMINQRDCPFCKTPSAQGCVHLALVAEGRDFVRRCIDKCDGQAPWRVLCQQRHEQNQAGGGGPEEDFTWLETAFCDEFLRHLIWFGGMDHEWRSGPRSDQAGFWVLLWSKDPRRLWWELREELERHCALPPAPQEAVPWLIWMNPR